MASDAARAFRGVVDNVERVIAGNTAAVRSAVLCLLSEGNLLLEGVPGVGKTMLARAIARSIGGTFNRVRPRPICCRRTSPGSPCTTRIAASSRSSPGPIFANVVLVDEINRTTPRTQSALLEPMEERQATVEGVAHPLPDPFFLVGTENPVEHHGTYPLPEGQLDRFTMAVRVEYPDRQRAHEVVTRQLLQHPIHDLEPVIEPDEVVRIRHAVRSVHVEAAVVDYALGLVEATRAHPDVTLGASPRAAVALTRCSQALAAASGRDFVLPDDLKALCADVLGHRLLVAPQRRNGTGSGREVIEELLEQLAVQRWLQVHTRYSLDIPADPPGADAVDTFLFERRRGYCEHIASAMAILLRAVGIPARFVVGFGPGEHNLLTGYYEVRESDAHSWVEVDYPGVGWMEYDPTFGVPDAAPGLGARFVGAQVFAAIARFLSNAVPGPVRAAARAIGRSIHAAVRAWPVAPVMLLALVGALILVRRRRVHWRAPPLTGAAAAFASLCDTFARRGRARPPHRTPSEHLDALIADDPVAREAASDVERIIRAFERDRFGASPPDEDEVERSLDAAARIRERVR